MVACTRMTSAEMREVERFKIHTDGLTMGDERIASESQVSGMSKWVYRSAIYNIENTARKTNFLGG